MGVTLAVAIVEDEPARDRPARLVPGVHLLADLHVRVRLVDEAPSGGIDVDRARSLARLIEGRLPEPPGPGRRQPPRLVHQVGLGAEPHGCPHGFAGVARVGDRPLGPVGLIAAVLAAHLGVVGEAAGGQQHPLAGADQHRRAVAAVADPDHPAVLDDQVVEGRLGPHLEATSIAISASGR